MMQHVPGYLWVLTYAEVSSIAAATAFALYRGARAAGLTRQVSTRLVVSATLLFGGWLTATSVISGEGGYRTRLGHGVPWLPIAVLGFFGLLLASSRLPLISRALSAPGAQERLLSPHSFRAGGIVFVIAMFLGLLPALFALPAGIGDIAVGVAAPWVARKIKRGSQTKPIIWFTVLGIADLVSALTLGALTGFLQIVHVHPSAALNADLPLAVIPTFGVPLLLVMHLTTLRVLFRDSRKSAEDPATDPAPSVEEGLGVR